MKKLLDTIVREVSSSASENAEEGTSRRACRGVPSTSRVYDELCIFCEKSSKYHKGKNTREPLIQCSEFCADDRIQKAAGIKLDQQMLITSRELLLLRDITDPATEHTRVSPSLPPAPRQRNTVLPMTYLASRFESSMKALAVTEIKSSTKKHLHRRDGIPLPANIYPGIFTTLAYDNIDRLEETISGAGTADVDYGAQVQEAKAKNLAGLLARMPAPEAHGNRVQEPQNVKSPNTERSSKTRLCTSHVAKTASRWYCLLMHAIRANYQAAIWRQSLETMSGVPSPEEHGWNTDEEGQPTIQLMRGAPAPYAVLQLLSYKCTRSYKLPDCTCLANSLRCTNLCKLQTR
ncbi:unnamed protein product [Leuciscus chuanchicus]